MANEPIGLNHAPNEETVAPARWGKFDGVNWNYSIPYCRLLRKHFEWDYAVVHMAILIYNPIMVLTAALIHTTDQCSPHTGCDPDHFPMTHESI